jgi:ribosome-binding protein aMBF1 (putative translation factor)
MRQPRVLNAAVLELPAQASQSAESEMGALGVRAPVPVRVEGEQVTTDPVSLHHRMMAKILRAAIAEQIRDLRLAGGMTQEVLAEALGTKQPQIARLEDPDGEWPSVETLQRIANHFDVGLLIRFTSYSQFVETYCSGTLETPKSWTEEGA